MTTYIAFRRRGAVVLRANDGHDAGSFVRHVHYHSKQLDMGRLCGGAADLSLSILAHHLSLARNVEDWRIVDGPVYSDRLRRMSLAWHSYGILMQRVTARPSNAEGFELFSDQIHRFLEQRRSPLISDTQPRRNSRGASSSEVPNDERGAAERDRVGNGPSAAAPHVSEVGP